MTDSSQCPDQFSELITVDKTLYARDESGNQMAVFVYTPLRDAYIHGYYVQFAPNWPDYVSDFAMKYDPLPFQPSMKIQDDLKTGISQQDRTGNDYVQPDKVRSWPQLMYMGWPLYYVKGVEKSASANGQPIMFEPATFEMARPTEEYGTPPGSQLGP